MKNRAYSKDKAVSEVIGYILVFSIVVVIASAAFTVYITNTGTNNEQTYQSTALQSMEYLDSSMFKTSTTVGSTVYGNFPMGIQGTFLSQKTPSTISLSQSSGSFSLSYKVGLSVQVQGYNPSLKLALDKVINSIKLGSGFEPDGITYDSTNNFLYVTSFNSNSTSTTQGEVFAVSGNQVKGLILPAHPYGVTFNSGENTLIISLYNSSSSAPSPGQLISIRTFTPFTTNTSVSIVNFLQAKSSITFYDVAYDPSTGDVLVSAGPSSIAGLYVYNASSFISARAPITVAIDSRSTIPSSLTYDPANGMIYVAGGGYVWGINSVTYSLVNLYPRSSPWGVAFDTFNGNLYVTAETVSGGGGTNSITPSSSSYNSLYVYNGTSTSIVKEANVHSYSTNVIYDPANRHVYVTSYNGQNGYGSVAVFNGMNPQESYALKNLTVGKGAGVGFNSMVYDPVDHNVYVCNFYSGNVSVIQGNTVLSKGWTIANSKLPLTTTLTGSGSLTTTAYTSFIPQASYSIEDGTVLGLANSGLGQNLSALPITLNSTQSSEGLSLNIVNLKSNSNLSFSTTNTVSVSAVPVNESDITLHSGEIVTLYNTTNGETLNAEILNLYLISMTYKFTSSNYLAWEYSFYKAYLNSTASEQSVSSLLSPWKFARFPTVSASVSGDTLTITQTSTTPVTLTSLNLNYYSFNMQMSG